MKVNHPQAPQEQAPVVENFKSKYQKEGGESILDTWVFEGKAYKAPEYEMPQPLEAAFKPSQGSAKDSPPYAYDESKFRVYFETTELENGKWEDASVVNLRRFGDVVGVTAEGGMKYKIELSNAQDGKYPVTKEEMLKAVHAAKLELGISSDKDST